MMLNILVVSKISVYQFRENILQWNVTFYPEKITYVLPFCGGLSGSHNWPFPRSTTGDFKRLRIDAIQNKFTSIRVAVHLSSIQLT